VWRHNRSLEGTTQRGVTGGLPQQGAKLERGAGDTRRMAHGGVVDEIRHVPGDPQGPEAMRSRARANFEAMAKLLDAAGVGLVMVTYPLDVNAFQTANQAMRDAAARHDVPLVDSESALARVPPDAREWLPGAHPNAALYGEIARDLVPFVQEGSTTR
jgi:hypothetical protein